MSGEIEGPGQVSAATGEDVVVRFDEVRDDGLPVGGGHPPSASSRLCIWCPVLL